MASALLPYGGDIPSRVDYPAHNAAAVTPSDSTAVAFRSLWVGGNGTGAKNVAVMPLNGDTAVTFVNVADGTLLPIAVRKVMSTNTTHTNIVGMI